MKNKKFPGFLFSVLTGFLSNPATGQETREDDLFAIRTVVVSVAQGEGGAHVPELGREDFEVLERGVRRDVVGVDAVGSRPEIVLLVDTSVGFFGELTPLRRALESFVGAVAGQNKMTIHEFGGRPKRLAGPTEDAGALLAAVHGIHIQHTEASYLLDAIVETAEGLGESERGEGNEVHIVIVTAMGPEYSHSHRHRAKKVGARPDTVYHVVISDSDRSDDFRRRGEIEETLHHLKDETGGSLTRTLTAMGLKGELDKLAVELRPAYRVSFLTELTPQTKAEDLSISVPKLDARVGIIRLLREETYRKGSSPVESVSFRGLGQACAVPAAQLVRSFPIMDGRSFSRANRGISRRVWSATVVFLALPRESPRRIE